MSKDLITILKFGVLILAVLPLSCTTILHPPDSSFKLDSNHSIIFGKDEVICNGKPVHYQGSYMLATKSIVIVSVGMFPMKPSTKTHLCPGNMHLV